MKAYKVELLIIDHDDIGETSIRSELENTRYSNHCILPNVMRVTERDIGKWHDGHVLNLLNQRDAEYHRLFESA